MPVEIAFSKPDKIKTGRRQFLKRLATMMGVTFVTGPLIACGDSTANIMVSPVLTTTVPGASASATTTIPPAVTFPGFDIIGPISNFKPDADPKGFALKGRNVLIFNKADGELYVFSDLCTHQGCQVEYAFKVQKFLCPCHNSEFDRTGEVVKGPAQIRLFKFEFKVIGDNLFVKVS